MLWVNVFVLVGYFFGNIPFIKQNFSLVIIALVFIPGIPALIEFIRQIIQKGKNKSTVDSTR
jgi:membrane-associated protein